MMLTGQLNLTETTPWSGRNEFVDLADACSPRWQERFASAARSEKIDLYQGVLRRCPGAAIRKSRRSENASFVRRGRHRHVDRLRNYSGPCFRHGSGGFSLSDEHHLVLEPPFPWRAGRHRAVGAHDGTPLQPASRPAPVTRRSVGERAARDPWSWPCWAG